MASWRDLQEEIREGLSERQSSHRGLNPHRRDFMTAVKQMHMEKVDRLLNQGVDPNFRDASGDFPLHVACRGCQDDESSVAGQIVERLVYMGADLEVQDRFSRRPLHVAASSSQHLVRILLEKGCSINAQDNAGCTALMAACQNNYRDAVETTQMLLQYEAKVYLADEQGYTALHCICGNTVLPMPVRKKVAELLLQAGISSTAADHQGRMALCHELDRLKAMTHPAPAEAELQLLQTLVCAGANLQHKSPAHTHWVRLAVLTTRPLVLLTLLRHVSPVLTRPSLRLINDAVITVDKPTLANDFGSNETYLLMTEVHRLLHTADSLQCLCRLSLRANLRGKLVVGVPQLPIPNKLKAFLTSLDLKPV